MTKKNRSYNFCNSYKKNKTSGYRKLIKTNQGRRIVKKKRKKGRKIF